MTYDAFPKRIAQVGSETFVIARDGDEFRMYAPGNPKEVSTVKITDQDTLCTCTEFSENGSDPEFRCKHILAVQKLSSVPSPVKAPQHAPENAGHSPSGSGARQMLLKRSVSPDGRIDSLSVEFSLPVESGSDEVLIEKANALLALQAVIVEGFLGKESNGNGKAKTVEKPEAPALYAVPPQGMKPARITGFGFRPTKWGERPTLSFEVEGEKIAVFGRLDRLREILTYAGYAPMGSDLSKPFQASLPCQVTVKKTPDGKYSTIDRVYPRAS